MISKTMVSETIVSKEMDTPMYAAVMRLPELGQENVELSLKGHRMTHPCPPDPEKARQTLILANLRLVGMVARQYQNSSFSMDDLMQEGTIGLIRAVDRFDTSHGVRFSTYAVWWIRQAILRAISERGRMIRVPAHIQDSMRDLRQAHQRLSEKLGRTPALEELAAEVGMSEEKVSQLLAAVMVPASLDAPVGQEQDARMGDLIPAPDSADPLLRVTQQGVGQALREALKTLNPQEQELLIARYGLNGEEPQTLDELSRVMKRSRERLRQMESQALQKLRRQSQLQELALGTKPSLTSAYRAF